MRTSYAKALGVAVALCIALPVALIAQQWDKVNGSMQVRSGPSAPLVIIDQLASGQKILSLRANGTEVWSGTSTGVTSTVPYVGPTGSPSATSFNFGTAGTGFFGSSTTIQSAFSGNRRFYWDAARQILGNGVLLAWADNVDPGIGGVDVSLTRDAANTLAQRNGANAQAFRVYNTYTNDSNYERLASRWVVNSAYLVTESAGTGVGRELIVGTVGAAALQLRTANLDRWAVNGSGHFVANGAYNIGDGSGNSPVNIYAENIISAASDIYSASGFGVTNRFYLAAGGADGKANLTVYSGAAGVGLDVSTDGILGIRTRAQTGNAQLYAASVRGVAVAFSAVPATPVEGMLVAVTDSSTDVWGATITGGGALHVLAYYNGTNWTVAGK